MNIVGVKENFKMLCVTLDTSVLINLLDEEKESSPVETILKWNLDKKIKVFVSNRIFEPDTHKMYSKQVKKLKQELEYYGVYIQGSGFRLSSPRLILSSLSGRDLLSGNETTRSPEEMEQFIKIAGRNPTSLSEREQGKRLSNKIGDFDALHEHYSSKRDVFITSDKHDYLHTNKRDQYEKELGLIIKSPDEFISEHPVVATYRMF